MDAVRPGGGCTVTASAKTFPRPAADLEWVTQEVLLPPECIQFFSVVIEAYDNLAMVRTPVRGQGRVYIFVRRADLPVIHGVLSDLARTLPFRMGPLHDRMLEDNWPQG